MNYKYIHPYKTKMFASAKKQKTQNLSTSAKEQSICPFSGRWRIWYPTWICPSYPIPETKEIRQIKHFQDR